MAFEYRKGYVYVQNNYAGVVAETDAGYSFFYAKEYLKKEGALAVSLSLPLTKSNYTSATLFPFFDGLIPEGCLLDIAKQDLTLTNNDRFGLLLNVCKDCIGDVRIENEANR